MADDATNALAPAPRRRRRAYHPTGFYARRFTLRGPETAIGAVLVQRQASLLHDTVAPPRFVLKPMNEDDRVATLTTWNALVSSGALTPTDDDAEHAKRLLNFPTETEQVAFTEKTRGGASHHRASRRHAVTHGASRLASSHRRCPRSATRTQCRRNHGAS